ASLASRPLAEATGESEPAPGPWLEPISRSATKAAPCDVDKAIAGKAEIVAKIDTGRFSSPCVKVLIARGDASPLAAATALAVARALARRGSAVLVAADVGDTAYDGLLAGGAKNRNGWGDLLAGAAEFSDVIHRDAGSRLHIIPARAEDGG